MTVKTATIRKQVTEVREPSVDYVRNKEIPFFFGKPLLKSSYHDLYADQLNPWPYINYLLFILKTAYLEFEDRAGSVKNPRGTKTELVEAAVRAFPGEFTLADLERACPHLSRDMIHRVLRNLRSEGKAECLGRGPGAAWRSKEVITLKRG